MSSYSSDEARLRAIATHVANIRSSQEQVLAAMEALAATGNAHAEGWANGIRGSLLDLTVFDNALDGIAPYSFGA